MIHPYHLSRILLPFVLLVLTFFVLGWQGAAYGQSEEQGTKVNDGADGVLLMLAEGGYKARLVIRRTGQEIDLSSLEDKTGHWLAITGVYTSHVKTMVGLSIVGGEVINRHTQKWDGLMVIEKNGALRLSPSNAVEIRGKTFSLKQGVSARKRLIEEATKAGITLVQSHMLVIDGEIDVYPGEDDPRFVRRLVVEDRDHRQFIWQSEKALTLYEAAAVLAKKYNALWAFNLDMGSYDYCLARRSGKPEVCGFLSDTAKLSNVLVIEAEPSKAASQ